MALAEKPLDYVEKTPTETETEDQRPNGLHEELDPSHPFDLPALLTWSIGNLPSHERLNGLVGDKLVVALDHLHHPGAYRCRDEECPRRDQYHRPAHIHEGGRYRPYHRDGAADCMTVPNLFKRLASLVITDFISLTSPLINESTLTLKRLLRSSRLCTSG